MEKKYAVYDNFTVEGPETNYTLHLSGYHGDVGEDLICVFRVGYVLLCIICCPYCSHKVDVFHHPSTSSDYLSLSNINHIETFAH